MCRNQGRKCEAERHSQAQFAVFGNLWEQFGRPHSNRAEVHPVGEETGQPFALVLRGNPGRRTQFQVRQRQDPRFLDQGHPLLLGCHQGRAVDQQVFHGHPQSQKDGPLQVEQNIRVQLGLAPEKRGLLQLFAGDYYSKV